MTKNFELSQFGSQLTVNDNTKEISIAPSVSIGGTLTYEDVTNIDSIGIVTARSGVHVPNGEILVGTAFSVGHSGIITSTRLHLFTDTGIDSGIRLQNGSSERGNIYFDGDQSLIIHGASSPGGGDTPTLEFATGTSPTTRLLITRDGNIGIGSISVPDSLVQIKSSGASANQARLTINDKYNSTDTSFGIDFKRTYDTGGDDQDAGYIHIDRSGGLSNAGLIFGIGNRGSVTEKLRIDSSGNARLTAGDLRVGDDTDSNAGSKTISVGSTSSGSSGGLQLWANPTNGNSYIQFGDGSASADQYRGWINYQHATDNLNFGTAGGEKFRITSGGNIGINSNDPTSYANSNATLVIEDSICPAICLSDTGQARDWFAIAQGAQLSINYADGGGSGSASNVTNAVTLDNSGNLHVDGTSSSNSAVSLLTSGFIDAANGINLYNGGFYVRRGFQASQGATTTLILDLPVTVCGIVIINSVLSYNAAARTHKILAVATRLANNTGQTTLVTQNGSSGGKNQSHSWSYYAPTTSTRLTVTTTDADTNLEAVVISAGGAG